MTNHIVLFQPQIPGNTGSIARTCAGTYTHLHDHFFIFGRETTGLPDWVKDAYAETALRIPMNDNIRSLNLSNTASLLIYEALRQQSFPGLH